MRGAHNIGEPLICVCGAAFMARGAFRWHGKTCKSVINENASEKNGTEDGLQYTSNAYSVEYEPSNGRP